MKLKVGHLTYRVRAYDEEDDGHGSNWGLCVKDDQEILIDSDLSPDRQHEILWHELSHAMWEAAGKADGSSMTEEEVCDFVGRMVPAILRDNPGLRRALAAICRGACIVT